MQQSAFGERFPLFNAASPATLEWVRTVATDHDYPADRAVLMEDAWGNAVYFIESGWVKVRRHAEDGFFTLAILGPGEFFGEMAILDESPRSTDVVAMTGVKLLSISAQRFIQTLFKDPQLHHRLLQLMVQRLRDTNVRFQLRHQPPGVKVAYTLTALQEAYGQSTDDGIEILNVPLSDLADIADVSQDDAAKIFEKLEEKGWLTVQPEQGTLLLKNAKQLAQLAHRV